MQNFKRRGVIGIAVAAAITTGVVGVTSSNADTRSAEAPQAPTLIAQTDALTASAKMPGDVVLLDKVLSGGSRRTLDRQAGRVLEEGLQFRYAVIPTTDGSICDQVDYKGVPLTAGCSSEFPSSGVLATGITGVGADKVYGVLSTDVSKVSVIDTKGGVHDVDASDGSFWWEAPAGETIAKLVSVRAGKVVEDTTLFPS